ncbi:MAG TPA: adenylate/guanylate cyclase domain-containing protein [Candidatus Lustribacter sp.]|jgi:class 3 adenylate cyclase|nr:adenylate/guanylate cyclase domain-containing protein [Candidatus Lustribacter sp.]
MAVALVSVAFIAALVVCWVLVRRWRKEQAEVKRVRSTFSRYVPPSIVEELLSRKDERIFTGREMRATILVCRIWNFSHFMEDLTPEQTLRYLNEFYAIAGSSIERQHGVLHRFLEDGAVGIFGIPLEDHHQEDHALRAAINIVRLVNVMQQKWAQQGRRGLRVGVGVNTGLVIAGDAGFASRREYTIVGPDVTLAHRLQAATFDLNAYIVAARSTTEEVEDLYNLVPISGIPLNGVRALMDASIVRGRKRNEPLILPKAEAFANTVIDEQADDFLEPQEVVPFDDPAKSIAPPPPVAAQTAMAPPPPDPNPPLKTRRRPRSNEDLSNFGFDLPELRMPVSLGHDEGPIMPDPPPPRATYEDNDGPPLPL